MALAVTLLACFCSADNAVLAARRITGDPAADETDSRSSSFLEGNVSARTGLTFPSPLPPELPFRGDAELFSSASRATGSAVFLAGLILIAAYLLKRYWPGRFGAMPAERQITVLESVALGERHNLTLVQAGSWRLLLARTPGSITLLDRVRVSPEAVPQEEKIGVVELERKKRSDLAGVLPVTTNLLGRAAFCLNTALTLFKSARQGLLAKLCHSGKLKPPTFEQVMRAELSSTLPAAARKRNSAGSRLSDIRDRLQAN